MQEIEHELRFKRGTRNLSFKYLLLNRQDAVIGVLDGIESAKISYREFATIKRSATFDLDQYIQKNINFLTDQIEPFFILHMPDGGEVSWELGIFMLDSPERNIVGHRTKRNVNSYDKSMIIEADRFTSRYFIRAGTQYTAEITKILAMSGIGKIRIPMYPATMLEDREYPVGTKIHEIVNDLLKEINYNSISVDEVGFFFSEPYVEPAQREVTQRYSAQQDSIVIADFTEKLDLTSQPNVFIRVAKNLESDNEFVSVIENHNPTSLTSIPNRGRRIVNYEEIDNMSSQQALDNYTRRIALNSMSTYGYLSFQSALMPTHGSRETLFCDFPMLFDAPKKFNETSWEMDLKYDGIMSHECRQVVEL